MQRLTICIDFDDQVNEVDPVLIEDFIRDLWQVTNVDAIQETVDPDEESDPSMPMGENGNQRVD